MELINTNIILLISFSLFLVESKLIECDKNPLLNAKIGDLTENQVKSEPTTFREFLEKFKEKSNSNFTVQIANENIREVCENSFEHATGINVLNLTSNGIYTLKPGCFSGITALVILDLSDNELQEIKNGVFNDFQHMEDLVLSNNAIAEIGIRAFGNLPALRRIRLDHNNIVILGSDWFQHSPNLRELDLSYNRITALGPRVLETIRPTCYIDSHVPIDNICPPGQRVNMLATGMVINLSYNEIISVHPDALRGLSYVDYLDLGHNKLISFKGLDAGVVFGHVDLRSNLPNLRKQEFPLDKVIIEKDGE